MVQAQFADLSTGYERFDALKKNLEGIFEKVRAMKKYRIDISYYEDKLETFKKEFKLADDFLQNNKMPFEGMQKDYEAFTLGECNRSLEKLTDEFEENITPIYNIYLLFNMIDEKIKNEDDDDIEDVIKQTILLIEQINNINTHNKIEVTELIERAYETIYSALLYEEVYKRHDILDYLKKKNLSSNRENIGKVIRDDVKKQLEKKSIGRNEVDEEFIEHLDEGLGYDYISPEFLSLLSRKSLADKYEGVSIRRQQMKEYMDDVVSNFNNRKKETEHDYEENKSSIRNLRINAAALRGKVLALALIPIITIGAGNLIGRASSNKITEYATTTRVVDLNTGEVVGEPSIVYDEHGTTYVATITIYEPWKNNPAGSGYIRNATAYEYIVPTDVDDDYHVTIEEIEGNLREKYRFNEHKDSLEETENMTDTVVYVTETFQDKTDSRKSTKFIIPFTIVGGVLGVGADFALLFTGLISLYDIRRKLEQLNEKIKGKKEDVSSLKTRLSRLSDEAESIMADKKRIEEKYGIEIDTELIAPTTEPKGLVRAR